MNILRITSNLSKAGAGAHVLYLDKMINKYTFFKSFIYSPRDINYDYENVLRYPKISSYNFYLNYVKTLLTGYDSIYNVSWRSSFKKLINDYDIIHLHHLQGYFFDIRSLEWLKDKNVVLTLHDYWPITGKCSYPGNCSKWISQCHSCPQKYKYPLTPVDKTNYLYRVKKEFFNGIRNLKVIVLSKHSYKIFQNSYLSSKFCNLIYPPINVNQFYSVSRKKNTKKIIIGLSAVKMNNIRKGAKDILNLFQYIDREKIDEFYFLIAGSMSKKFYNKISNYPFVKYIGYLKNNALNSYYNKLDTYLNLSEYETFGKTIIEAQVAGIPVVTSNIPPFRENNLYCEFLLSKDPESIITSLYRVNKTEYDVSGIRKRILNKYDLNKIIKKYEDIYNSF